MPMLNTLANFAFYGSFIVIALAAIGLGFCAKWIFEAWLFNRRMNAWCLRHQQYCQTSDRACFKASRYAK